MNGERTKKLRRSAPISSRKTTRLAESAIVVSFEQSNVPALELDEQSAVSQLIHEYSTEWDLLQRQYGKLELLRLLLPSTHVLAIETVRHVQRQNAGFEIPAFLSYFRIKGAPSKELNLLAAEVSRWKGVDFAYPDPAGQPSLVQSPLEHPAKDPQCLPCAGVHPGQFYLHPAPFGIGATAVWPRSGSRGMRGADGQGLALVDLEDGFDPEHEDLRDHFAHSSRVSNPIGLLTGSIDIYRASHGTSVLGIICATNNNLGCCGIVPLLSHVGVASGFGYPGNRSDRIVAATAQLMQHPGGVLLIEIELQSNQPSLNKMPVETLPAEFGAIQFAVAAGITVVEAAGNGGQNLDMVAIPPSHPWSRRSPSGDSGAILVAAAQLTSSAPQTIEYEALRYIGGGLKSNIGSRINCFAPGNNLVTCSTEALRGGQLKHDAYTFDFGGTSGAAAIIAGAALSTQGMVMAKFGSPLKPEQLRYVFANDRGCTRSRNGLADKIGVMPNLASIAQHIRRIRVSKGALALLWSP